MRVVIRITAEHRGGHRERLPDVGIHDAHLLWLHVHVGDVIDVAGLAPRVVARRLDLGADQRFTLECEVYREPASTDVEPEAKPAGKARRQR